MNLGKMNIKKLVEELGLPYSEELGIDLQTCSSAEICKWFLASVLLGARIGENIAKKTYKEFESRGVLSAQRILETGWEGLVEILDLGGYVRYDFKTADKLLDVFGNLLLFYGGDLNKLHEEAKDSADLEEILKSLGRGIGEVTVAIFLRDMRHCWEQADPKPTSLVSLAMQNLGIKDLKDFSKRNSVDPVRLETALLRLGKDFCRKRKCSLCMVKDACTRLKEA